jgi:hypothetical protein
MLESSSVAAKMEASQDGLSSMKLVSFNIRIKFDSLCDLAIRVPGYRSRDPGFDSRRYQIFWEVVGLERGPLSLLKITEEILGSKVAAPV